MAISNGTAAIKHKFTREWVNVGVQTTPSTTKASITFNLNKLQEVNSNADKNGMRASVLGFAVVRYCDYALGADAVNGTIRTAQVQREGMFSINISQPNLSTKYQKQDENLALMGAAARNINPAFCALVDNLPPKQGLYQDIFSVGAGAYPKAEGTVHAAFDRFSSLNQFESWNDNYNFATVSSLAGESASFVDATMIPACQYSGDSNKGAWFDKDVIPLAMLTNNNTPWTVKVQCEIPVGNGFNNEAIATDNMDLWVLVTYTKKSDKPRFGMLWSLIHTPVGDGNYNPLPLLYRMIAITPTYNATTVANGITLPYDPIDAYTFVTTAQLRLYDDGVQCFPRDSRADYQVSADHFNYGSLAGGNPKLRWDYFGKTATTIIALNSIDASLGGSMSTCPWVPLATNHLFMAGFPPAFMSDPNASTSRMQITYSATLTSAQKLNVVSIHVNEFYDADAPKMIAYALFGDSNQPAGVRLPDIIPLVDEFTNKTDLARKLVPFECNP